MGREIAGAVILILFLILVSHFLFWAAYSLFKKNKDNHSAKLFLALQWKSAADVMTAINKIDNPISDMWLNQYAPKSMKEIESEQTLILFRDRFKELDVNFEKTSLLWGEKEAFKLFSILH